MRIFTAAALVIFSSFTASIAATPAPELNKRCIAETDECKILAVNECCDGKICVPSVLFFLGIGECKILHYASVADTDQVLSYRKVLLLRIQYMYENLQFTPLRFPELIVHDSQVNVMSCRWE